MAKDKRDTFDRQMSAVIGKLLSDLEEMPFMRELHPTDFDKVRRRGIKAAWECYVVGRERGIRETKYAKTKSAQSRAVSG